MKRILNLLLVMLLTLSLLCSCDIVGDVIDGLINPDGGYEGGSGTPDGDEDENPDDGENNPSGEGNGNQSEGEAKFTYTAFTDEETLLIRELIGDSIPFAPNNDYGVEEYSLDLDEYCEKGVNFYTAGNSEEDFEAYRELFSAYTLDYSEADEHGDVWYFYTSESGFFVDMCYYVIDGVSYIDVYAYLWIDYESGDNSGDSTGDNSGDNNGDNSGEDGGNDQGGDKNEHTYTDFTAAEKTLIKDYLGELIPFVPSDDYFVELDYDYYGDEYLAYYTFGNTEDEFMTFFLSFDGYELTDSFEDEYGDTWYCLEKGDIYIELSYYTYEGEDVIDLYAYYLGEDQGDQGDDTPSGGDTPTESEDADIITNAGAGLPDGADGVHKVDFTKGEYVQDVHGQGYYLDGCPTTGSPKVLVIPIHFSDVTAQSKGCTIDNIVRAFMGDDTDYYSVDEYYYISSYGKLDLDITVVDQWFKPQYSSSYYASLTDSDGYFIGDQAIMDEALAYLSGIMDLSDFDSDGNSIIDAVVMINTLEVNDEIDFNWAYRYWNYYVDEDGYYYEYDGVSANDYLWASYFFMHESYTEDGDYIYSDTSVMNTYTFIHEFGHILGADDYYDTSDLGEHPMEGLDIMDSMAGDHNPYTKFNLGWVTESRLVTTDSSLTLTLESFTKTGDSIIIASNWDDSLGVYQEYYVVVYYTMDGLNGDNYGYFLREGIVVYHINASLYREEYEGEIYYDVYNNNTHASDEYGTEDNLVEFVTSSEGNYTYVEGDSLPTVTDDQGSILGYGFTVDSIDGGVATLTFTKN